MARKYTGQKSKRPITVKRTRGKYNNNKPIVDGIRFDSNIEALRYKELQLLLKANEIYDLRRQVAFELQPGYVDQEGNKVRPITYKADFTYFDKNGKYIIEDVKSEITAEDKVYKLKKKMMGYHGNYITEVIY